MSIGLAILLTLLGTTLTRVGIVLLKQAIAGFSDAQARRFHSSLLESNRGRLGLILQLAGFGLFLAALIEPSAPVSLLQPLRAFGILVMVFLSVVLLKERLGRLEWAGVVLQMAGILLLGFSLSPAGQAPEAISLPRLLAYMAWLAGVACLCAMLLLTRKDSFAELSHGVLAGVLLGIGYLQTKVLFLAWADAWIEMVLVSTVVILFGTVAGLAVLLWSFRSSRALVVTTINFVINQVVVIIGGTVCLGERFPEEPLPFWARLGGLVFILIGVVLLARFQETPQPCPLPGVRENDPKTPQFGPREV